jgi:hypothetical protein
MAGEDELMIYSDSRYSKGTVIVANDSRTNTYPTGVYRVFPKARTDYYSYTWVEGDRIDLVANYLLGTPFFWWKIMDFNPEIPDPFSISVGTVLRIPRV